MVSETLRIRKAPFSDFLLPRGVPSSLMCASANSDVFGFSPTVIHLGYTFMINEVIFITARKAPYARIIYVIMVNHRAGLLGDGNLGRS